MSKERMTNKKCNQVNSQDTPGSSQPGRFTGGAYAAAHDK